MSVLSTRTGSLVAMNWRGQVEVRVYVTRCGLGFSSGKWTVLQVNSQTKLIPTVYYFEDIVWDGYGASKIR